MSVTIVVLDASGLPQQLKCEADGGGILTPHQVIEQFLAALPAGTNLLGSVDIVPLKTIQRQALSFVATPNNDVIAGVVAQTIKVLSMMLIPNADVTLTIEDTGALALSGPLGLKANQIYKWEPTTPGYHHFETSVGRGLRFVTSGGIQVSGNIVFAQY